MKLIAHLEKSKSIWFLLFISFAFFLLRWPSLFEPYWYGDEGIYQAVGLLIRSGAPLYSGAWDNKPPLLYLLYALFNSDQFLIRFVSLIFGIVSIWVFYLLAKRLFHNSNKIAIATTTIYSFGFGTRMVEGNIANAENFMILPILVSAYFVFATDYFKRIWQYKTYFLAGLILSLAFLTKIVAAFDFLAFGVFLFIDPGKSLKENFFKKAFPFVIGFTAPVILTMSYFLLTNNFKDFLDAFIFSNVGYVGYGNNFLIPQGLLYFKAFLLISFSGILYLKRRDISKNVLFITLWFAFSLFNAFFSQRPYTHYLLVLLPSFCLMIGVILSEKRERIFTLLFLIVALIIVFNKFSLQGKLIPYYINLLSFCSGKIDVTEYQSYFDHNTPRDYELARYIRMNTDKEDSFFIWGNNAQVYKLANKTPLMRYTVAYHITQYSTGTLEMKNVIDNKKPKFLIIMPNVPTFPLSTTDYRERIRIKDAIIYERAL
ncbi:MAG: glycosyltransferase family 39 protein [Patescibacteria group bacterium]